MYKEPFAKVYEGGHLVLLVRLVEVVRDLYLIDDLHDLLGRGCELRPPCTL